jgi:glycosyltransferase 2 family protein
MTEPPDMGALPSQGPGLPPERVPGTRPASPGRRAAGILLQLALTAGVTVLVFRALGGTLEDALALDRAVASPRPWPLAAATLVLFGGYALAARLWGWMVGNLGDRDPGARLSLQLLLAANLGRYVPGKIWQLAGLAVLVRRRGMSAAVATAASLLVQGFALAATLAWGLPSLLSHQAVAGTAALRWTLGIVATLVVLASIPAVSGAGTRLLFRLGRRDPDEAPRPGPGFGPRWLGLSLLNWGVYGVAFVLFLQGLGFTVPPLEAVSAFAAAYLVGNLFVAAPAGVGIREVALAGLLLPELGDAAMAVAILARLWMTAVEVIPAAVFAWIELRGTTP